MEKNQEKINFAEMKESNNIKINDLNKSALENGNSSDSQDNYKPVNQTKFKDLSFQKKILFLLTQITVEPFIFLVCFNTTLIIVILPSFIQFKICAVTLGYDKEVCDAIETNQTLANETQDTATNLNMIKMIIESIPSAIVLLFIGSWSDRFGRKIPMCLPAICTGLSSLVLLALTYWMKETPPETVLISSVFQCFTGGFSGILVSSASYLSDITPPESRTMRMALMQGIFMLATPLSSFVGGILLKNYGYISVFIVPAISSVLVVLYVVIRLPETVTISEENKNKNRLTAFIDLKNLKDCYHTCVKPRENYNRFHLFLIFIITFCTMIIVNGEASMYFWYVQKKFGMSRLVFTQFITTMMGTATFGMLCIPLMTSVLKFSNATLGIIAFVNRIGKGLTFGLVTEGWMMFAGCGFLVFSDLINPVSRAIISQLVKPEELGKIFSIMGACEVITLAFSSIIYTNLYNATRDTVPGAIFFLTSALSALSLILFCIIVKDSLTCRSRKKKFKLSETKTDVS